MDEADRAQVRAEQDLALALARRPHLPVGTAVIAPVECMTCGDEIPLARQQAMNGTLLCVECQAGLERRQHR